MNVDEDGQHGKSTILEEERGLMKKADELEMQVLNDRQKQRLTNRDNSLIYSRLPSRSCGRATRSRFLQ